MLKFENTAEIGDTIRAFDFKPRVGVRECYVEGVVIDKGMTRFGYAAYTIIATEDVWQGEPVGGRKGAEVLVPFEISMTEWDGRVLKREVET